MTHCQAFTSLERRLPEQMRKSSSIAKAVILTVIFQNKNKWCLLYTASLFVLTLSQWVALMDLHADCQPQTDKLSAFLLCMFLYRPPYTCILSNRDSFPVTETKHTFNKAKDEFDQALVLFCSNFQNDFIKYVNFCGHKGFL